MNAHDELTKKYYIDKTITKEEFESSHAALPQSQSTFPNYPPCYIKRLTCITCPHKTTCSFKV